MLKLRPWPNPSSLKQSTQLHAQIVVAGALHQPPAAAHLLKCIADSSQPGSLSYAQTLFAQIPRPSSFVWNTIIRACYRNHVPRESITFYRRMHQEGVAPDAYTFHFLFRACGLSSSVLEGLAAHGVFVRLFPEFDAIAVSSLIHMYTEVSLVEDARRAFGMVSMKDVISWTTMIGGLVKLGSLDEARRLFDEMPEKNVVSWTTMMAGYSQAGRATEAVRLFKKMLSINVKLDAVAMVAALTACAELQDLELGKHIHWLVKKESIVINGNLAVSLIDMYSKCHDIKSAREVFDSLTRKIQPAWNAMIDGYCKMGNVDLARSLFDRMEVQDIISYNSMITGYIHSSRLKEALLLFSKLHMSGLQPDKFTIVGLLTACASLGALSQGKALHAYIELKLVDFDVFLGTALLDMYGKCGKMDQALLVFDKMKQRDVQTWTTIISGFAMNGMGKLALQHFSLMKREGVRPNSVAFVSVLTACSHSGLVEEGRRYFEEMRTLYNLEPEIEHYGCMVDLLGRGGYLKEASEIIETMPMEPNAVIWGSMLSSCRVYKDVDLAEKVAKHLLELEPHEDAAYVQLYNIYVDLRRWADAFKIRGLMEVRGVRKTAGFSSITINGQVHKFLAGDQSHPEMIEIQRVMSEMARRLKLTGYSPSISQVSVEVDDEEKEQILFAHSEKMAIAFGILKLAPNLPIYVLKNLRVCEDCHSAIKLISKIWSREIVVRDRSRFHHFHNGHCSCSDFW